MQTMLAQYTTNIWLPIPLIAASASSSTQDISVIKNARYLGYTKFVMKMAYSIRILFDENWEGQSKYTPGIAPGTTVAPGGAISNPLARLLHGIDIDVSVHSWG
jgi:hypothetical protein